MSTLFLIGILFWIVAALAALYGLMLLLFRFAEWIISGCEYPYGKDQE